MNNYKKISLLIICLILLGGCSHTIQLTPHLDNIRKLELKRKIDKNVGYFISNDDLNKEVTSWGGGGDKVNYQPYKDTLTILNTMLSRIFNRVYSVKDINNAQYLTEKNISYIFLPTIKTSSFSTLPFTWPPTNFKFELTCKALDAKGNNLWEKRVVAEGTATYEEFLNDFSLSARRASDKAFRLMMMQILGANELQ